MVPYMRYFTYPARRVLSWSCLLILTETAYDDWLIAMTPLTDPRLATLQPNRYCKLIPSCSRGVRVDEKFLHFILIN